MTATIAYDKSVENLIDQLSATGHVTHTAYKKTSVTLHHNGGRLSHAGVLSTWKTRPASAHFDVDASGSVAQYVKVNEYAWAVGNTSGNQSTISIEQANSTLSPNWEVAEATWKSSARLAGWLFAKVIGERPSKSNFFVHKHWSATDCAGPYIDKVFPQILAAAQSAYDTFKGTKTTTPPPASKPTTGKESLSQVAKDVIAGKYGNNPGRTTKLKAAGYDPAAVQAEVNAELSGKKTTPAAPAKPAPAPAKNSLEAVAKDVIAGKYGNGPDRTRRLAAAGYSASAVQAEVNVLLGAKTSGTKSIKTVAAEVIAGKWGNNPQRAEKLAAAGYNAASVQAEVNRRVK